MSDRQNVPAEVTPDHRPDRPIATAGEDRLGRGDFVRRLARALVRDGRSTGVVIGLTGPWGSGKSSVLNLLEAEIKVMHAGAVVVRFDPWLVSGRDDVISQFFTELLATITEVGTANGRTGDTLLAVGNKLAGYAKDIGHAANFLLPGAGAAVAGLAQAAEAATARDTSLARQRRDLAEMLAGVAVPIVVLVDELDRVEDGEVRAVAQLVRAVADFPGLSYVLAYDRRRVVEALGGAADTAGARGSAYLEKIVQLELPLPVALIGETDRLLEAELAAAAPPGFLPAGWSEDRRFRRCVAISAGVLLGTPRDVRRVCGMYAVLAPMVAGEVDWVDLFGYTVLLAKTPGVIDAIRQQPALVAQDAPGERLAEADWETYVDIERGSPNDLFLRLSVEPASAPARLLGVLFPRLVTGTWDTEVAPVDGLRHYRSLMTVLRLGLSPDAVSRSEVQEVLTLDPEARLDRLRVLFADGRLALFLDRLLDTYADLTDSNPDGTLRVLGGLTRTLNPATPAQRFAARRCGALFDEAAKRVTMALGDGGAVCQGALVALIEAEELDGPATLLRHQFFAHGLFGRGAREPENAWLPEPQVRALSHLLGGAVAGGEGFDAQRLLETVHTSHALLLANEVGAWTAEHRAALSRCVETSHEAMQRALLLFFGDGIVEAEVLDRFVDARLFHRLVSAEFAGPAWDDPTMAAARAAALRNLGRG